jgi:hypothetical protein
MDYFAPAVATDHYGDVVVAASESNSVTDPTVALFGERPPFTAVTGYAHDLVQQFAEYDGPDWGGYSAVAADPADPAAVWTDAQEQIRSGGGPTEPNWDTLAVRALASTPKSWPGSTPAFGTRYDQTATLIYRRADGKLEWLQSSGPCPDCWDQAQHFTPSGGTNAAPALDPQQPGRLLSPGRHHRPVQPRHRQQAPHPAIQRQHLERLDQPRRIADLGTRRRHSTNPGQPTTSVPWGTEVIAVGPDQHLWADLKPVNGNWTGWDYLYSQAAP